MALLLCLALANLPLATPQQASVGHMTLSTCHQIQGKSVARSYIILPENESDLTLLSKEWCEQLRKLAPPKLHDVFGCSPSRENARDRSASLSPTIAVFNSNIFNKHTKFPFSGTSKVGEMSVEINSDTIGMDSDMYWSRKLWSDGTAGSWKKADCSTMGQYQAVVSFFVKGNGYHQTLVSDVALHQHQEASATASETLKYMKEKKCNLAVVYTMETGQYMDLDELREARPYSGVIATSGAWSIDVEKPSEQSTRHVVALRTTGCPKMNQSKLPRHIFQTPIHFRYQRAQSEHTAAPSCVLPPRVFVRCNSRCTNANGKVGEEGEFNAAVVSPWEAIDDVVLDYGTNGVLDGTSTRVCRRVPVGNERDMVMVSYLTAVSTFAGAFVIWCSSK